jgi:hypothetical protein
LFGLVRERGEPIADVDVFVVEGAFLEGDQVPVDGGAGVFQFPDGRGQLIALPQLALLLVLPPWLYVRSISREKLGRQPAPGPQ